MNLILDAMIIGGALIAMELSYRWRCKKRYAPPSEVMIKITNKQSKEISRLTAEIRELKEKYWEVETPTKN